MTERRGGEVMINLAKIRTMKGLTQAQLADRAGLTQETISLYESGKQRPFSENIFKIAVALECTVDDLFRGEV